MPWTHSTNSPIFFSFSGFPKFKQFVIAIGSAPTEIKFLQLSHTICFPPDKGWAKQYKADESTDAATALDVPWILTTPESPPGFWIVSPITVWSYWSHIHCLSHIFGCDNNFFKQFSIFKDLSSCFLNLIFCGSFIFFHFLSYTGAFSAKKSTGMSQTFLSSKYNSIFFEFVVFPIIAKSRSHLSKIFLAFSSFPFSRTISILSWLSDNIISYGLIFSSLHGTIFRFNSIPSFPFDAISTLEDVNPAAPISWIEIIESSAINSRQASNKSFSVKGSPTWTVGFFSSILSSKTADAILAPCIPSLPVFDPT